MSLIISQDITQPIDVSSIELERLSSRDVSVIQAFQNEPWLPHTTAIDQKFCLVSRDLLFQILMIENISKSKLNQIDDIKTKLDPKYQKIDRLSTGKDKIVIHQVNLDTEETDIDDSRNSSGKNVFKITLQDKSGAIFYAVNAANLPWLNVCMLGSKLIINKNAQFVRSVFLLSDSNCVFLGGVNQVWNENREAKFRDYMETKLHRDNDSASSKKRKTTR